MIIVATTIMSQATYTTAASGNFSADATWVGGLAGKPPQDNSVVCNCKIVIAAGHTLTMDITTTLSQVNFVLDGVNSVLTFANDVDLTLIGPSSIDIQVPEARIVRGNTQNNIFFGTTMIYSGAATYLGGIEQGRVDGIASAASVRANPQFQSGTLPVVLSDFRVAEKGSNVSLTWTTQTEINSSHFAIERSTDNKQWSVIGTVQASGNNSVEQNYSFTDPAPADGTNYYRLRIVDIDNAFKYSLIKTASFKATTLTVITGPNPATSYLNINVSSPGNEPYRLRLVNRTGQVVYDQKQAASTSRLQLNVSNYADGTYFVEVSNSSGLRKINQVMIVRR